jgi:hypothetical protein
VADLATNMENLATYTADVIRGFGLMAGALKKIPGLSGLTGASVVQAIPILGSYITLLNQAGAQARRTAEVGAQKNPIQSGSYLNTQKKITALTKEQQKAQAKILADKKSQAILDKANLALAKGNDVFNMDAIQLNAALIGQAEALGKATTSAQILGIANDVQRLKVKQSIADLEDAIASKDDAAIAKATAKLNENLKILGALQKQDFTLLGIKTILDSLKPKSLIDQENLNMALDKIREMLRLLAQAGATPSTRQSSGIPTGDYVAPVVFDPNTSIDAVIEYADAATERATAFAILQEQENYAAYLSLIEFQRKLGDFGGYSADMNRGAGYGSGSTVTVEIIDRTSGLIEVVQTAVQENNRFGNNLNFAGAI